MNSKNLEWSLKAFFYFPTAVAGEEEAAAAGIATATVERAAEREGRRRKKKRERRVEIGRGKNEKLQRWRQFWSWIEMRWMAVIAWICYTCTHMSALMCVCVCVSVCAYTHTCACIMCCCFFRANHFYASGREIKREAGFIHLYTL